MGYITKGEKLSGKCMIGSIKQGKCKRTYAQASQKAVATRAKKRKNRK